MRWMMSVALAGAAAAFSGLSAPTASAEDGAVRFDVEYVEIREGMDGRMPLRRAVTVSLRGGNQIVASEEIRGGRKGRQDESESTLGGTYQMFEGRRRRGQWRVEAKDTLVRRSPGRTDTEILVLKVEGTDRCKAGVGYVLFPGETRYFRRSGWYDRITAESVTCRISRM